MTYREVWVQSEVSEGSEGKSLQSDKLKTKLNTMYKLRDITLMFFSRLNYVFWCVQNVSSSYLSNNSYYYFVKFFLSDLRCWNRWPRTSHSSDCRPTSLCCPLLLWGYFWDLVNQFCDTTNALWGSLNGADLTPNSAAAFQSTSSVAAVLGWWKTCLSSLKDKDDFLLVTYFISIFEQLWLMGFSLWRTHEETSKLNSSSWQWKVWLFNV